jgi:hypothetical protein
LNHDITPELAGISGLGDDESKKSHNLPIPAPNHPHFTPVVTHFTAGYLTVEYHGSIITEMMTCIGKLNGSSGFPMILCET